MGKKENDPGPEESTSRRGTACASVSDATGGDEPGKASRRPGPGTRIPPGADTNAAVIATDREGVVTRWSRGAERIFGWEEAEVLGRPLPTVLHSTAEEFERLRDTVLSGTSVSRTVRRHRRDGTVVEVHVDAVPVRSRERRSRVEGMLAVITEVSGQSGLARGGRRRAIVAFTQS